MDINGALQEYGLTDQEITVYLILLQKGKCTLQEVAKETPVPRSTVYNTLNYLGKKGLVSKLTIKNVSHYSAADPIKFKENLKRKENVIDSILPELSRLKDSVDFNNNVEVYEGAIGVFTVYSDVFKEKGQKYYFGSHSMFVPELKHYPMTARQLRIQRKIPAKIILDSGHEPLFDDPDYKKITEIRYLPLLKNFKCTVFIYGKKVGLFTHQKGIMAIIISHEQVAIAMKILFDTLWEMTKK